MYHIVKTKSKSKPFSVVLIANNGEVLSQHSVKTKQAAFKNAKAQIKLFLGCNWIQDDTYEISKVYVCRYLGAGKIQFKKSSSKPNPKYIPGKNLNKKKGNSFKPLSQDADFPKRKNKSIS